ncbi:hypothetical protein ACIRPH_08330 [Nocardiopsis sp. NPDC101807]|uniref:hypothetical protein n=1 Tax=Nocardiopsis sp. NPDC101807 TaxID=3364339 RepID=UPI00380B676F
MARTTGRALPCGGPTLHHGRCRRRRLVPPCRDHTPHALARRAAAQPWSAPPTVLRTPRRRGVPLLPLLGSPWPSPAHSAAGAEHARHWMTPRTRAALDCFASLVPAAQWNRVASPRSRADCPALEALARACESPRAVAVGALHRVAEHGFADLPRTHEHRIARTLAHAKEVQVSTRSFTRADVEHPGPHLEDIALSLRLLGVLACLSQGRAPWCPCLHTLLRRGPLPAPCAVFSLATRFAGSHGLDPTA